MQKHKTCKNCVFWDRLCTHELCTECEGRECGGDGFLGWCHAMPPQITSDSEKHWEKTGGSGCFPTVSCHEWCGKFFANRNVEPKGEARW